MARPFLLLSLLFTLPAFAQENRRIRVADSNSGKSIPFATVAEKGARTIAADSAGWVNTVVTGSTPLTLSATGYQPKTVRPDTLTNGATIFLLRNANEEEEIVVRSFRTESRIENLPTRIEVLGSEEVTEEVGIKPGNIASLVGDIAGIQIQQASAVSGNVEMRIQGLPGKYTQLLRDGMPLFGAFAGNFSVLQLPPLDLKQIEIVKGSSSTLYGGGAISGMVNVLSKRPTEGALQKTLLLNQSSLGESNAHLYLSQRHGRTGFTFFAGGNRQVPRDVDGDGYTDLAKSEGLNVHPALYLYPTTRHSVSIGYTGNFEDRRGGDLQVIKGTPDAQHAFFIRNRLARHTGDLQWEYRISDSRRLALKAIGSLFDRSVDANSFGGVTLKAQQLSYYSEFSYLVKAAKHDLVAGLNLTGQSFHSGQLHLPAENSNTVGVFVQDDWRLHPKWTLEGGLRTDFNSRYGAFVLPRLSLMYRISTDWMARLGGGLGYRLPTVFESDVDERDYFALTNNAIEAERSIGGNMDVNFHRSFGEADLTVNQSVFITSVRNVAELQANRGTPQLWTMAASQPLLTRGTETYVQLRIDELEAYLGYTYTDAQRRFYPAQPQQPLIARNKFAAVLAYEFSDHFRAGIEAAQIGRQYREDGSRTPAYLLAAAMLRYDWRQLSFVLNCENLFDYRQSRKEFLLAGGDPQNPRFRELWAPIDGRVANLSVRLKW
ncbi:TonB-dependent receptor [Flaviaesturariibacter aridisoli]|uniref:TonB-dependent receptor n=1 Tax=Flaviaesturariibacter aridisoli TaxID=2545761 RepID=A0A4R4E8V1_9BACT|nr:TonB-dependent receptor [Flaviaesturariibacter aridisoli]TCZ74195.1 TonB-dependent receptor [Flaviaesturariibacter aridisoli]